MDCIIIVLAYEYNLIIIITTGSQLWSRAGYHRPLWVGCPKGSCFQKFASETPYLSQTLSAADEGFPALSEALAAPPKVISAVFITIES